MSISELEIKRGSQHYAQQALDDILKEKQIQIPAKLETSKTIASKIGNLDFNIDNPSQEIAKPDQFKHGQTVMNQNQSMPILGGNSSETRPQLGLLPSTTQTENQNNLQTEERKPLDPKKKEEYQRFAKESAKMCTNLMVSFGVIEGTQKKDSDIMTEEGFNNALTSNFESWANYCYEHNVELPDKITQIILGLETVSVLFTPLIMLFLKGRKEKSDSKGTTVSKGSLKNAPAKQTSQGGTTTNKEVKNIANA